MRRPRERLTIPANLCLGCIILHRVLLKTSNMRPIASSSVVNQSSTHLQANQIESKASVSIIDQLFGFISLGIFSLSGYLFPSARVRPALCRKVCIHFQLPICIKVDGRRSSLGRKRLRQALRTSIPCSRTRPGHGQDLNSLNGILPMFGLAWGNLGRDRPTRWSSGDLNLMCSLNEEGCLWLVGYRTGLGH